MTENDFLTAAAISVPAAYVAVKVTALALRHRAAQLAAGRKADAARAAKAGAE
jgi:hypothetical protein